MGRTSANNIRLKSAGTAKKEDSFIDQVNALRDTILEELDEFDASDVTSLALHNHLTNRFKKLYSLAEAVYTIKPTQSNAYVISNFSTAIRELRDDIEVSNERNNIAETLNTNIVYPAFRQMSQEFIQSVAYFRESLNNDFTKEEVAIIMSKHFAKNILPFAKYLDVQKEAICSRITENVES